MSKPTDKPVETQEVPDSVGRRFNLTIEANKTLTDLSDALGVDEGVLISKAIEVFAETAIDEFEALIMHDAELRAKALRKRLNGNK